MADFCAFATLRIRWRPICYLMLPAGFASIAAANATSPKFVDGPAGLYDRLAAVIGSQPRIRWLAQDRAGGRMELIQFSRKFRFSDRVSVAVLPGVNDKGATLAVYSRAQAGIWDFGVNRARVRRWARALEAG